MVPDQIMEEQSRRVEGMITDKAAILDLVFHEKETNERAGRLQKVKKHTPEGTE